MCAKESREPRRCLSGIPAPIQQWATSSRKIATHEAVHLLVKRREEQRKEELEGTLTNNSSVGSRMCEEWHSLWTSQGQKDGGTRRIREKEARITKRVETTRRVLRKGFTNSMFTTELLSTVYILISYFDSTVKHDICRHIRWRHKEIHCCVCVTPKRVEEAFNHLTIRNYFNEGTRRDSHEEKSLSTEKGARGEDPMLFNTAFYFACHRKRQVSGRFLLRLQFLDSCIFVMHTRVGYF